jgi:hypothetical protein
VAKFHPNAFTPDPPHYDCAKVDRALRLRNGRLKNASRPDEKSLDVEYFYQSAGR